MANKFAKVEKRNIMIPSTIKTASHSELPADIAWIFASLARSSYETKIIRMKIAIVFKTIIPISSPEPGADLLNVLAWKFSCN